MYFSIKWVRAVCRGLGYSVPGYILSDVEDFIRTEVNLAPEDEPDL